MTGRQFLDLCTVFLSQQRDSSTAPPRWRSCLPSFLHFLSPPLLPSQSSITEIENPSGAEWRLTVQHIPYLVSTPPSSLRRIHFPSLLWFFASSRGIYLPSYLRLFVKAGNPGVDQSFVLSLYFLSLFD
ncbi:hypothetical protein DL98DRAFT_70141 [Cadophora sp. DSE1049]|nr:hypothetical protein DL98DRAFT_70141 [Cadophora sp. DSE1049]